MLTSKWLLHTNACSSWENMFCQLVMEVRSFKIIVEHTQPIPWQCNIFVYLTLIDLREYIFKLEVKASSVGLLSIVKNIDFSFGPLSSY